MNTYEIVTEQIAKQLESGVAPWRKPWATRAPRNLISQREYTGLNVIMLASQGYASPYWLTFNQATKLGGHIRKDAKSSLVVFWQIGEYLRKTSDSHTNSDESPDGGKLHKSILLRYYRVFNLAQTEGIAEKLGLSDSPRLPSISDCESIVSHMPNSPTRVQDARAFYRPSDDSVGMPARDSFETAEGFYATLFHELTHSTGHASRVGREGIEKLERFGSESYSKEELIAELGSAMLCGVCGISPATLDNSASYLQSWINALKSDSRLIVSAASAAQKAANYIRGIAKEETPCSQ